MGAALWADEKRQWGEREIQKSPSGLEVLEKVKKWRLAFCKSRLCLLQPGERKSRREHKGRSRLQRQRDHTLSSGMGNRSLLARCGLSPRSEATGPRGESSWPGMETRPCKCPGSLAAWLTSWWRLHTAGAPPSQRPSKRARRKLLPREFFSKTSGLVSAERR